MSESGLLETYRGAVAAWECDAFGHMNIAHYPRRFAAAAQDFLERAGAGGPWRTASLDVRYLEELRAAAGMVIRTGAIEWSEGRVLLAHEGTAPGGARTTLAEHLLVGGRAGAPSLAALAGWERFQPADLPPGEGAISAGRDRVRADEAEDGALSPAGHVHRFSDANVFVMEAIGMSESYRRSANRGFATFETRLALTSRAAPGEGIAITSGIIAIGTSSLRMLHRMRQARDGRLVAEFYQAGVHFDLAARRSAPWPAEIKDSAQTLVLATR